MKLPLFVACLVAGSTWSFAFADVPTTTQNPKTVVKEIGNPKLQATPASAADMGAPKQAPIEGDADAEELGERGVGARPSAASGKNSTGTSLGAPAPAGGTLGVVAADPWDNCATPMVVVLTSGLNTTAFDLTVNTTGTEAQTVATFGRNSGGSDPARYGNLNDIWITFTAPWNQFVTVRTCGLTSVDTKLAFWANNVGCPIAAPTTGNDNSAFCSPQSRVLNFYMTAGVNYTFQLGASPLSGGAAPGLGSVDIETFMPGPTPLNDDCSTPTAIGGTGAYGPIDITGATENPLDPWDPGYGGWCDTVWGHDVWFAWTCPLSGSYQAQTCSTTPNLDTMLAVYGPYGVATCPPMTTGAAPNSPDEVGCNDDGCGAAGPSNLIFTGVVGQIYMVRIGGWNHENHSTVTLEMFDITNPPPNDDCLFPTPILLGPTPYNTLACTTGLQGQAEALCNYGGSIVIERDAWFTWTDGGGGGCTKVSVCGGTIDSKIAIYAGSGCPGGSAISCNDDACGSGSSTAFIAAPGATYTIQLGSYTGSLGSTGTISVAQFPAGIGEDNCATPLVALLGANAYSNLAATTGCEGQSETLCGRETGSVMEQDIWFTWTAPVDPSLTAFAGRGWAQVTTCGLTTDNTKIAVYAGAGCPTGFALACRDASCGTGQSTVIFPVVVGQTYTIQIGNPPGVAPVLGGVFDISYIPHPAPCAAWDDGTPNIIYGSFGSHDYAWMNRFGDVNQTVTINSVDIAFGVAFVAGGGDTAFGVPNGTATDLWVWQDGLSQDGDPSDAVLLLADPIVTASAGTDILVNYVLSTPITVTGFFFVGTHVYQPTGIVANVSGYTIPFDTTFHDWENTSWNFRRDGARANPLVSEMVPSNLSDPAHTIQPRSAENTGSFGQSPIRVNCTSAVVNNFCLPGFGLTIPCPCGNQPTGWDRGCNNREAIVGNSGAQLSAVGSASLAAPLATSISFTATGLPNPGSNQGILMQGKLLSNGKQFGHGVVCFNAFKRMYNRSGLPWTVNAGATLSWTAPIDGSGDTSIPVRAVAAGDPIPAGAPRFYQVYYRDNAGGFGLGVCENLAGGGTNNSARQNITHGAWTFWAP